MISAAWSQDFLSTRRANQDIGDVEDMDPPPASWYTFPERQTHWIRDLMKRGGMADSPNKCLENQCFIEKLQKCMDVNGQNKCESQRPFNEKRDKCV